MSYILDALNKSEQERGKTPAANPKSLHEKSEIKKRSRPLWIYLIPVLLLMNIILLWPTSPASIADSPAANTTQSIEPATPATINGNGPANRQTAQTITPEPNSTVQVIDSKPAQHPSISPSLSPTTEEQSYGSATSVTEKQIPGIVAIPDSNVRYERDPFAPISGKQPITGREVAKVIPPNSAQVSDKPKRTLPTPDLEKLNRMLLNQALVEQLTPLREEPQPHEIEVIPEPAAITLKKAMPTPVQTTLEPQSELGNQNIPELTELNSQQREDIPPLNISVHIYTEIAANRMARINGAMRREGEMITDLLKLEQITPNALIFRIKEQQFQIRR